jgi:ferredoxin/flavodoxin---NADP+ reductase
MSAFQTERVLTVHHWTDQLFSFTTTRDTGFRFVNGQFTMIGLPVNGKPLLRAYSIASANHEETLEFFSIKVPDGPLTSRLQHLQPGDELIVGRKPTGTLLLQNLLPGGTLWLLATGTGLAPFLSLIKDPDTYERFAKVVIVHGCRTQAELAYRQLFEHELHEHEYLGEFVRNQLLYYPTVTREKFRNEGRITELMSSGKLYSDLGLPAASVANDRFMICGSPAMLRDLKTQLEAAGFTEGNMQHPGHFVVERAFADR